MTKSGQHRSLRDAFSQYATGVTVVTARNAAGLPVGLTANSFASVSLEPPLVSWCIDKASTRYKELVAAEYYSISVLNESQQNLSNLFAFRSWDDTVFDEVEWYEGPHGVPQFPDVGARFHCKQEHQYPGGDHLILVGRVESYESDAHTSLVFFQGKYKTID
ncbi:MAG: flavin reductase family protein [Gammaproteobacteria bacterium]|nr:flavin reductase family protein [Gammaproteobacteria bacterium]